MNKLEEIWVRWRYVFVMSVLFLATGLVGMFYPPYSTTSMVITVCMFMMGVFYQMVMGRPIDMIVTLRNVLWSVFSYLYVGTPIMYWLGFDFSDTESIQAFINLWRFLIAVDLVVYVYLIYIKEIPRIFEQEEEEE